MAVNTLDNEIMGYFDSKTNNFEGRQSWMHGSLGQEYFNRQTKTLRGHKDAFKQSVREAMVRFNQSEGKMMTGFSSYSSAFIKAFGICLERLKSFDRLYNTPDTT